MSDYGALLRCKPLVWLDHTARLVPHIASRLLGVNREIIPSHILNKKRLPTYAGGRSILRT